MAITINDFGGFSILKDIKSMTPSEIVEDFQQNGIEKFRVNQVQNWLNKGIDSFDLMINLPKDLRKTLSGNYNIASAKTVKKLVSRLDSTVKYLFELNDGNRVESVVMRYRHGRSMCLSTQVGCRMGCTFCATGADGFIRNLTPSEMLSQITSAQCDLNIRISNIVLMGMGEPLDNFDNVMRFLALVTSKEGLNIGSRHITLSTCGIPEKIDKLADYNSQITLSVSLHAPNDEIRGAMMPVNKRYSMDSLLDACKNYTEKSGRRVTFEYILIDGVNDAPEHAGELAKKLAGMLCHVNLIPANPVSGKSHKASGKQKVASFASVLNACGVAVTVRRTLGADINASCGQLRKNKGL